jgi:phosphomannomutase
MDQNFLQEVTEWILDDPDANTAAQLQSWLDSNNEIELRASFSGFLQFGTAGLRGPVRPGPSGMNRAVVARTSAGLVAYMKSHGLKSVVIGQDARHGSKEFAYEAAAIFSGAGMTTMVLSHPLPTPVLAFATKELGCDVGIMVTASHNPPQDNGFKVYLGGTVDGITYRGSQITSPTDSLIADEISKVVSTKSLLRADKWSIVDDQLIEKYVSRTARLAQNPGKLKIVYTAMHGVGTETLLSVFKAAGFDPPQLVVEQAQPDPDFPTVAFPNPEEPGAMDLAIELAKKSHADLVIATDPDVDRCAVAIQDPIVGWRILHGDELGAVFAHVISQESDQGVFANSIVSSTIVKKIAQDHSIKFQETLTGFKWISKIQNLSFGYEEALGYCVDPETVNDKDGISAAIFIAQIAIDLARDGRTILDLLSDIWSLHGYHATEQISIRVNEISQVKDLLTSLRSNPPHQIAGRQVTLLEDLSKPKDGLPPTDGLRIWLEGSIRVIIRPSGTEAKLKCYIEVIEKNEANAKEILNQLRPSLKELLS